MIDTHAHLDEEPYRNDLAAFILAQQQSGVEAILIPGVDVNSIEPVATICRQYPNYLYPAIGLHPENVRDDWQEQLETIHRAIDRLTDSPVLRPYIAIGEIGLDYHFDTTYKEQQQAALREQLNWAMELDLPVMLHVRDATEDALAVLREYPGLHGVMHCWSGSEEVARQIVDMGLYLGIGGIITFKNCKLREHLSSIPLERIVLETDAPYMAPVPHRGERNESAWIRYVMDELSKIYGVSVDEIDRITTQNAKALFGL